MSIFNIDMTVKENFRNVFRKCSSYHDAFAELSNEDSMALSDAIESVLEDTEMMDYDDYEDEFEKGYQILLDDFFLRGGNGGDEEDF